MTPTFATIVGVVLQVFGAGYLVFQSWSTSRDLSKYPEQVTYGTLHLIINALTGELRRQFFQQMIGFLFLLGGSGFLLYAAAAA